MSDVNGDGRWALPEGWECVALRDIAEISYGKSLTVSQRDESGQIPVYGSSGIVGYHTQSIAPGPTLIVGRKGAAGAVHYCATDSWPIDTAYYMRFPEHVSTKYAYYALQTLELSSLDRSTAIPSLSRDDLYAQTIPLAPLPDQHRIVAEIEKQFTRLDAAVAALRRAKANLARYKAAVLQAAVEGRLVAQTSEVSETSEVLLARILAERRAQWEAANPRKQYIEPKGADVAGLPGLPVGWVWATVEQVLENHDARRVPVKKEDRAKKQGLYPYYGASGVIDYVDGFLFDGEFLLIAEDGANLLARSTPIAFQAHGQFWVNNHAHIVQCFGGCPLGYIETYFNSIDLSFLITGTAQPKLTQANLNQITIPFPPLDEQRRIVNEVERHLSIIQATQQVIDENLARADRLRQGVLGKAFRGELVANGETSEVSEDL